MKTKTRFLMICIALYAGIAASIACQSSQVESTPTATSPPQLSAAPVSTVSSQATIPSPTEAPLQTPNLSREELSFSTAGFSITVDPEWDVTETADEVLLSHPIDSRIWISITHLRTDYTQSTVDERISEEITDSLVAIDPLASYTIAYPATLADIQFGRTTDYVYTRNGQRLYGGFTVGTNIQNHSWIVRWEAPAEIYPELLPEFLNSVHSFTLISE